MPIVNIELEGRLLRLREATDEILKDLRKMPDMDKQRLGSVNWGRLSCVEARYFQNHAGKNGYSVLIKQASPDCRLGLAVMDRLASRGFPNVEVNVEW